MTAMFPPSSAKPPGAIFEEASHHCDVRARIARVPDGNAVRGVFFGMVRDDLRRRSPTLLEAYERELGVHPAVTFRMYPLVDYLRHIVVAGSLVAGPSRVHDGMRDLHRGSARYFAESVLGRLIVSLANPSPISFLRPLERRRHLVTNYGRFRLDVLGPRRVALRIDDEPAYLESAQLGGFLGVFDVCGVIPHVETFWHDDFSATYRAEW